MPPDPLKNFTPDQKVKVLPRHLAGPGPVDPRRVWGFPTDQSWPFHRGGRRPGRCHEPMPAAVDHL